MRQLFIMQRSFYIIIMLCFLSLAATAQQQHFIYIQANNKLPFSVKLNSRYYSSSSIGYLIIPKLADGTYKLQIGFAQNSFPEQAFTLNVMGKDYGYALKNFDAKGWGLFNFQTTDIVMNTSAPPPENTVQPAVAANTSAFGNMLANVINDSSINNVSAADTVTSTNPVIAATIAAAPDTAKTVAATTNITTAIDDKKDVLPANKEVTAKFDTTVENTAAFTATGVIKAWENASDKGTDLMFIDFNGTHNDTINAFIPAAAEKSGPKINEAEATAKIAAGDTVKKALSNPFFNQNSSVNITSNNTTVVQPNLIGDGAATTAPSTKNIVTNGCVNMLSDGDLNKLKKRIIAQTNQDAALAAVRKTLRERCITAVQVKDLGNLFLNDESRYGLYDAVYSYVSDINNYAVLESTLIDPYFKNRFKALLR